MMSNPSARPKFCKIFEYIADKIEKRRYLLAFVKPNTIDDVYLALQHAKDDIEPFIDRIWYSFRDLTNTLVKNLDSIRLFYILSLYDIDMTVKYFDHFLEYKPRTVEQMEDGARTYFGRAPFIRRRP